MRGLSKWVRESALACAFTAANVKRPTNPDELFEGVEKPTVTLAKMLAAETLCHLDVMPTLKREEGRLGRRSLIHTWSFPSFKVIEETVIWESYPGDSKSWRYVDNDDQLIAFDDAEKSIIKKSFNGRAELVAARRAAKVEEDRQNSALNFIEKRLGIANKPKDADNA